MSFNIKRLSLILLGLFLASLGLWGGSYVMYNCAEWMLLPAFVTGLISFSTGIGLVSFGIEG